MTLVNVSPNNPEILKETATLFQKMSAINGINNSLLHWWEILWSRLLDETWNHIFQLKGLQLFIDAVINMSAGKMIDLRGVMTR